MSKQVALQKSPPEFGSWVVITFLPRGSNSLRTPLLLTEKPGELAAGATQPESTKKIGPYQVSIAQSAAECWNYDWDVGGLHLSLANAFEDSGAARFTCAQMEQIVASIR